MGNPHGQAATEYLLLLAAVLVVVGAITTLIFLSASSLGTSTSSTIDNIVENIVTPGLVGMLTSW